MLPSDGRHTTFAGFASFGECIIARIEIFALLFGLCGQPKWSILRALSDDTDLELVLQQIFLVRELAIEAEELLLLFREGLGVCERTFIGFRISVRTLTSTLFFCRGFILDERR